VLIHHENKNGKVSGAWEGAVDTLLHVNAQGNGRTRVFIQKARWSSAQHGTTLELRWASGEGFELTDPEPPRPERTWDEIADYVLEHGGCGWNEVDKAVSGRSDYLRERRDQMLAEGLLINAGAGQRFELWHRDDPARPALDTTASEPGRGWDAVASDPGRGWDAVASDPGDATGQRTASPRPPLKGDAVGGTRLSASPAHLNGGVE
jgi:hypothetical protein